MWKLSNLDFQGFFDTYNDTNTYEFGNIIAILR